MIGSEAQKHRPLIDAAVRHDSKETEAES